MAKLRSLSIKFAIVTTICSLISWVLSVILPGEGYGNLAIWLLASSALFITPYTNLPEEKTENSTKDKFDCVMECAVSAFYATVLATVSYMAIPYVILPENSLTVNMLEKYGMLVLAISLCTSFFIHVFATLNNMAHIYRTAK